ncbi:MAG: urease accessory protein UreF [Sarcina ventriculi]|uniref:Urease accessory protein UreF n=1 Tax=Sarcina ventriculi TaxID=1267 RepID=A0ABM9UNN5_SARVE|nr:urease accessory protein UreF [Sarcina ventriculi]MCI5636289.1 urease accessory protein UreF [Sarcina ventriculi]MDD7373605.1 urease accessory protein UreF [Sarcina ventriculi]MDY7061879.1 urease accessory protein UreF [Sarcina ventriculi]CUN67630.1 Urease accessory protein UreF [Sarcina ventriculi]
MLNLNTDTKILKVLKIIQLCDSNFPVGSFNHSYGMETYLRKDEIKNTETFRNWLKIYLNKQFIYSDGLCIRILYDILKEHGKLEITKEIIELDRKITVQSIAKESRDGAKLIAGRMIRMFIDLYDFEILKEYDKKIKEKEAFGHPAIVFALALYSLGLNVKETICYHIYSTISTLIQNAVRTIPLGQKDGQILLKEFCEDTEILFEKIENADLDYFGLNVPGIELSQINHETLIFRLFMS